MLCLLPGRVEAQGRSILKWFIPHASKACMGMQLHLWRVQKTFDAFVGCVPWPQHYSCSDMRRCKTFALCQLPWFNVNGMQAMTSCREMLTERAMKCAHWKRWAPRETRHCKRAFTAQAPLNGLQAYAAWGCDLVCVDIVPWSDREVNMGQLKSVCRSGCCFFFDRYPFPHAVCQTPEFELIRMQW